MHQANQRKWAGVGEIEREQEKQKIVTYWRMFDAKSNEKRIKKKINQKFDITWTWDDEKNGRISSYKYEYETERKKNTAGEEEGKNTY